ncbi:MAG TPA: cytochrome c [Haliangiales bacterium]|nr:cytochrome c [Haliangiales bacterium]
MRWVALSALFALVGCSQQSTANSEAAERGRLTYMANCIACHNADPAKPGTLGPAVKGSSRELIEARVLRAAYPRGYTPKRDTKQMVPQPQVADKLDDLAAYLR